MIRRDRVGMGTRVMGTGAMGTGVKGTGVMGTRVMGTGVMDQKEGSGDDINEDNQNIKRHGSIKYSEEYERRIDKR
jgi:hypothetical protein